MRLVSYGTARTVWCLTSRAMSRAPSEAETINSKNPYVSMHKSICLILYSLCSSAIACDCRFRAEMGPFIVTVPTFNTSTHTHTRTHLQSVMKLEYKSLLQLMKGWFLVADSSSGPLKVTLFPAVYTSFRHIDTLYCTVHGLNMIHKWFTHGLNTVIPSLAFPSLNSTAVNTERPYVSTAYRSPNSKCAF